MEIITKKIHIEQSINRKFGMLPYIEYNGDINDEFPCTYVSNDSVNGNWGNFVINPGHIIDGQYQFDNYIDMNHKYNTVLSILYRSTRMRRVSHEGIESSINSRWSWSTKDYLDGYCYTYYDDNDVEFYDYYPVSESFLEQENSTLFKVKDGYTFQDTHRYIIVMSEEDYETFIAYDDETYRMCKLFDKYIGKLYIPKYIKGYNVPLYINYCEIEKLLDKMLTLLKSSDCCMLTKYKELGGDDMVNFLNNNKSLYSNALYNIKSYLLLDEDGKIDRRCIPTIDLDILLTTNYNAEGISIPYVRDEEYDFSFSGIPYEYISGITDFTAESQLSNLRDDAKFYDDNDIELPGIFERFNKKISGITFDSAIFYYNEFNKQWEESSDERYPSSYEIADICASIPNDADTSKKYLVRYNNNSAHPMRIPYSINAPKNISIALDKDGNEISTREDGVLLYEAIGDFIFDIIRKDAEHEDYPNDDIEFYYVLGGHFYYEPIENNGVIFRRFVRRIENTGVVYHEKYKYSPLSTGEYTIDGKDVIVYYEDIKYDTNLVELESKDFGGEKRMAKLANIVSLPLHDMYSTLDNGDITKALTFRPDYIMGITDELRAKANISISRGNAAAFERHFKLTECNTIEDLVNYGNNFFKI